MSHGFHTIVSMLTLTAVIGWSTTDALGQTCSTTGHPDDPSVADLKIGLSERSNYLDTTSAALIDRTLDQLNTAQSIKIETLIGEQTHQFAKLQPGNEDFRDRIESIAAGRGVDRLSLYSNSPWQSRHLIADINVEYDKRSPQLSATSRHLLESALSKLPEGQYSIDLYNRDTLLDHQNVRDLDAEALIAQLRIGKPPDRLIITQPDTPFELPTTGTPDDRPQFVPPDLPDGEIQGPIDVDPILPSRQTTECIDTPCANPNGMAGSITPPRNSTVSINELSTLNIRRQLIADATVLITFMAKKPDGSVILDRCVGSNMGDGRILTAAHCLIPGTSQHVVWFGDISWGKTHSDGPRRSRIACKATQDSTFKVFRSPKDDVPLDAAILNVSTAELNNLTPEFLKTPISVVNSDPWCTSFADCKHPTDPMPKVSLSVAQVWAADPTDPYIAEGFGEQIYSRGIKTLSASQDDKSCGTQSYGNVPVDQPLINAVCARTDTHQSLSPHGYAHDCDTMPGSSGAPMFRQLDIDAFVRGRTNSLPLAGLHRAGEKDQGNCVVPASYFASALNQERPSPP